MKNNKFFWSPNEHLEAEVIKYFTLLEEYNQKYFEGKISILLLGSMSRGEASWSTINGIDTIVSDIEFITIVPLDFNKFDRLDWAFESAKNIAFPDQDSSLFHIDTGIAAPGNNLGKLERKLLTFDANVYGYCVVGPDIKDSLPVVTISNINMQDIWEILVHRIFSAIYWGLPLRENGHTEEYRYNIAKNSLDIMTVILVNNGQLISGFKNRLEAIKQIDIKEEYKCYFEYCLSIKLSTTSNKSYTIDEMETLFLQLLKYANDGFGCHCRNYIVNLKFIFRRYAGMTKRMLKARHLPSTQKHHFKNMICYFENPKNDIKSILLDNYVLNGYPQI